MNDSNVTGDDREELELFVIIMYLHYMWSDIMLFESGLGFAVKVYCKLRGNH